MHLGIFGLAVLIDDFGGFGVCLAHLSSTEVAVDEDIIEWGHRALWVVLAERELILGVVLQIGR